MEQPLQLSLNLCPGAREKKKRVEKKENKKLGVEREREGKGVGRKKGKAPTVNKC